MAFQKSGSKFSPKSSFQGAGKSDPRSSSRSGFKDRSGSDRPGRSFAGKPQNELSDAVCEKCGRDCKVPFRPQNGKPVYCSDCFGKNEAPRSRSQAFELAAPTPAGVTPEDIRLINKKLDQIMRALEIN